MLPIVIFNGKLPDILWVLIVKRCIRFARYITIRYFRGFRSGRLGGEHFGTLLKEISRALQECDAPSILAGDAHLLPARQARTSAFAGGLQQGPSKT